MTSISKKQFKIFIDSFDFTNLFNQLGWSFVDDKFPVKLKDETYNFKSVAEKGGFRIIVFMPSKNDKIPDYIIRLQLDRKIGNLYREHLLIFQGAQNTTQIWQLFVKQSGKPSRLSETRWNKGQEPELLFQKTSNLFFTLIDEENITIVDVLEKVEESFYKNVEQVTKKFYENFRKEHRAFIEFIKGISAVSDKEWYASLMLNRLMFCYFIQKKGFLDNNTDYLKEKLVSCQTNKGKDKYYVSFYKNFLMTLFHQGLGSPEHSEEIKKELGRIPYLNGGLFDVHELEKQYQNIDISDEAFLKVFNFFDQYNWHLDSGITATGRDINPDVIGYIFEKYINDRAQMGAYYTKEDITDYISKNCIIPYLFDEAKRRYPKPFNTDGEIWQTVRQSSDEYIYNAVKKGVYEPLPEEIAVGITDVAKRTEWNKQAPENYALPTEIWREVVDRRNRCHEVKQKIENGEITSINDFITYNLNIRQFAQDVIDNTTDPEFLKAFYKSLNNITIIDPTSGSGAFLFAAMNILELLYESCIQRMEIFVAEAQKGKYKFFEETLEKVHAPEHPNLKYFIYKSIILRNLYGVDIMKEATEIAKLRLFLKLVASVDADYQKPNLGLEPLPDIDFNIRSGNTLVGFATIEDAIKAVNAKDKTGQMGLVFDGELDIINSIKNQADDLARVFKSFKNAQLDDNLSDFKEAKDKLMNYQANLNGILNEYLAFTYGIDRKKQIEKYNQWLESHQPFHWFAEFYEIIHEKGGFDVVIGNPPYVEYGTKLKSLYILKDYSTIYCGNLHAYVAERCFKLISTNGFIGLIIPLPSISTSRMLSLQNLIKPKISKKGRNVWISTYDERPSSLFDGVDQRLIIEIISNEDKKCNLFTTGIKRWYASKRKYLFPSINYSRQTENNLSYTTSILKIQNNRIETEILKKFYLNKSISLSKSEHPTKEVIYYRTAGGRYWKVISNKPSGTDTVSEKAAYFHSLTSYQAVAIMSSSTFWWYYSCHYDMFNLKDYMIFGLRFSEAQTEILTQLNKLGIEYLKSLEENAEIKSINSKTKGTIEQKQYVVCKSKSIIDEIDKVLAKHYGFTPEELDFIINYDIKYRMGKELGEEVSTGIESDLADLAD